MVLTIMVYYVVNTLAHLENRSGKGIWFIEKPIHSTPTLAI